MKSPRHKDPKTSRLGHSSPPLLPMDLMMDIFSRLSLKSIAICRCVSKQWASLLGHSGFRDLRLTRSQARPRLLFACSRYEDNKVFFLSSPQPQSPDADETFAVDYHMSFSFDHPIEDISASVSGFVCVSSSGYRFVKGRQFMVEESRICNPSTGQSFTLPRMKTKKRTWMVHILGYDPVEKLHKVLGMMCPRHGRTKEHQVLTLGGSEKPTWRMLNCGIPCSKCHRLNTCINGVFYYTESVRDESVRDGSGSDIIMVISFDVRSDKFSFVKFPERNYPLSHPGLLDYNGKLASVANDSLHVRSESIVMWVLQDPERHEWSKRVYILPTMWKDVVDPEETLEIGGVTGPNEFVMSPRVSSDPFHVYYCNFEKETVRRVVIQGMGAFGSGRTYSVRTSLNHVEDLKLMEL